MVDPGDQMHERFSQTAWLENRIKQGIRFVSASCQRHPLSELPSAKKKLLYHVEIVIQQVITSKQGSLGGMGYALVVTKRFPITSQSTTSKNAFT